ncbi:MAG: TraR/DksA C4-type zinc finger protein [Acidimicrobiia bacterium]
MATTKKTSTTKSKSTPKKATTAKAASAKKTVAKKTTVKKASSAKATSKKVEPKKTTTKVVKKETKKVSASKPSTKAEKESKSTKASSTNKNGAFRCPISGLVVKAEKPNLSPKTLEKLKEILLEERQRHLDQSDELAQEAVELIADREGGDTQFDEESGEGDSVAVERERSLFLSAEAANIVDQIDRALARMKDGTYGLCSPSGRRITVARLEALPWTEVCVDCKARSERRR